jgi:cytochrome d ubiquinol oxidase subunit I
MIGFGALGAFAAVVALWLTRKGTVPSSKWLMRLALLGILAPFAASAAGWIFTEMGRQPFVVAPNPTGVQGMYMFTAAALSPGVSAGELLFSTIVLTSVYAALAVFEVRVLFRYVRGGVVSAMPELDAHDDDESTAAPDDVLSFAY